MRKDICLVCRKRPKRKEYQFCSDRCTSIAAKKAPQLMRVPKGHVFYENGEQIPPYCLHCFLYLSVTSQEDVREELA